jgi:ABC-type branched-subunit amino acid transport system substrate-binding protein
MLGKQLRWAAGIAGIASLALAVAGCSSSGGTTGSGSSSTSNASAVAAPKLNGAPVTIGSMYPISASLASFPDLQYMAEIAVNVVNANGGIKGRPLKWVHCDDKGDPNVAATCADQLIKQDKVAALVESVGIEGNVAWPLIKKANILNWFNVPIWPEDGTSPLSYPAGLGIFAHQNVGLLAKPGEFKKVDCIGAAGAFIDPICGFAKAGLAAKGTTDFRVITYPATTTAFQPYAAKVLADGADAVVVVASDAITAPVLQAFADAGVDATILEPSTSIGTRALKVAHENSLNLRVAGSWAVDPDKYPARKQMLDNIEKYRSAVGAPADMDTLSDNAFNMYEGVLSLATAMNGAKSLKTADLQAYVAAHPVSTGVAPPLEWSKAGPIPKNERIVQVYGTAETVNGDGGLSSDSNSWGSGFPNIAEVTCCSS